MFLMVLNLKNGKCLPLIPTLVTRDPSSFLVKRIGPRESNFIRMDIIMKRGSSSSRSMLDAMMSKLRFMTLPHPSNGVVLSEIRGNPAMLNTST